MTTFALIDCNNFYASCERLFDPTLAERPVVVLSNNDGCVIARCGRAKALGIPMGMPFFKLRPLVERFDIAVRSSNYELYGDLSRRVMTVLSRFSPRMEIYSIDEAFLTFDNSLLERRSGLGEEIRATVSRWVGIPVSIGLASTKTLAKAANWQAKHNATNVFQVRGDADRRQLLTSMPIQEVWGIGARIARRLSAMGLHTAADFVDKLDARQVRREFTITGWRTWRELVGVPCLEIEDQPAPRQTLCTSRSFGREQTDPRGIEASVASFAATCAAKLRSSQQVTPLLQVFLATNRFRPDQPQAVPVGLHAFDPSTNDTLEIVAAATKLARALFRRGYSYKKAGVLLLNLQPEHQVQGNLFDPIPDRPRRRALMNGLDRLNRRYGDGTVTTAAAMAGQSHSWHMRQDARSPRCTTRWDEILSIR